MGLMNAIHVLLEQNSFAIYLILIAGFALLVVGAERIITLFFKLSFNTAGAMESIRALILEKKYTEALQICNSQPTAPELRVIKAGLVAVDNGREAMKSALSGAVLDVNHQCEKRIPYLALIANVATLLGLLGTIVGLITTFQAVAQADPATKAQMLGLGISEAMYATAAGLVVGITAMVIHTLCTSKTDHIVADSQDAGLKLITWIEQSERVRSAS